MSSVSTAALAVAVADAGGVGSITALGMTAAQVDDLLAGMAARTAGVLAANFLTGGIDPEAVAAAAARVRIVDFFWADPDPALVEVAHRGGALVCWQVGSLDEAVAAADAGCDVVAVQGTEAGGHVRGHSELRPLLESVLGRVDRDHRRLLRLPAVRDLAAGQGAAVLRRRAARPGRRDGGRDQGRRPADHATQGPRAPAGHGRHRAHRRHGHVRGRVRRQHHRRRAGRADHRGLGRGRRAIWVNQSAKVIVPLGE